MEELATWRQRRRVEDLQLEKFCFFSSLVFCSLFCLLLLKCCFCFPFWFCWFFVLFVIVGMLLFFVSRFDFFCFVCCFLVFVCIFFLLKKCLMMFDVYIFGHFVEYFGRVDSFVKVVFGVLFGCWVWMHVSIAIGNVLCLQYVHVCEVFFCSVFMIVQLNSCCGAGSWSVDCWSEACFVTNHWSCTTLNGG